MNSTIEQLLQIQKNIGSPGPETERESMFTDRLNEENFEF